MSSPSEGAPDYAPIPYQGRGRSLLAEQILAIAFAQGLSPREGATLDAVLETLRPYPPVPAAALAAVAEIVTRLHAENTRAAAAAPTGPPADPEAGREEGTPLSWT